MRFPLTQAASMATYIAKNKLRPRPEWQKNLAPVAGPRNPFKIIHTQIPSAKSERKPHPLINKRFPLVLMLEPLHACNLTCTGCGRIREYESTIRERLSLEQCLKAVDECGAPMEFPSAAASRSCFPNSPNCARRFWPVAVISSSAPTACSSASV